MNIYKNHSFKLRGLTNFSRNSDCISIVKDGVVEPGMEKRYTDLQTNCELTPAKRIEKSKKEVDNGKE